MSNDLDQLAAEYHKQLFSDGESATYYASLGITIETIEMFRLGWIHEPLSEHHESLVGLPVIPYQTIDNRVMQLRVDGFQHDKEHNYGLGYVDDTWEGSPSSLHLYNSADAMPSLHRTFVHLCPDVHSALMVCQVGSRAVAVPGWKNFFKPWSYLFQSTVVYAHFNEETEDDAMRVLKLMGKLGVTIRTIRHTQDQTTGYLLRDGRSLSQLVAQSNQLSLMDVTGSG